MNETPDDQHQANRQRLADDVARFLENGGQIRVFPHGASAYDPCLSWRDIHDRKTRRKFGDDDE